MGENTVGRTLVDGRCEKTGRQPITARMLLQEQEIELRQGRVTDKKDFNF